MREVRGRRRLPTGAVGALRYVGAVALLAVGADHLDQFAVEHYAAIPTIGTLFALNFASATIVAAGLAMPVERLSRRFGPVVVRCLALGGVGIAAGSLAGLLVSERATLFGFMESGYRAAVVVSIALEAATMVLLGAFLVLSGRRPSTTLGRTWLGAPSHQRSPTSRPRSWKRSGTGARPPSAR